MVDPDPQTGTGHLSARVNALIDQYRAQCLWLVREDYYPAGSEEMLRMLDYIKWHGDLEAFCRASELTIWLSTHSSERFAG